MRERRFGSIDGVEVATTFQNRKALAQSGIHPPTMAGISYSEHDGADSIVLNGGYEDDVDDGDVVIYTGHGGNDPESGRQVADQLLRQGNLALAKSCIEGLPVRVTRGWREPSGYGPPTGFRYDGLYRVVRYWSERGRSGFVIWRYRLERLDEVPAPWQPPLLPPAPLERRDATVQRIVRNTALSQQVKDLYRHRCQVCNTVLETPAGPYAEGAHLRPLGRPHDGPDAMENLLCLCPNHHVLLDTGAIAIEDDLRVLDRVRGDVLGVLRILPRHHVSREHLRYHRELFSRP